ncbi:uridine kinase family protein [Paenibacillus marinisediminis]
MKPIEHGHRTLAAERAVQDILFAINQRISPAVSTLVVALDGGSGAGKSTLAAAVTSTIPVETTVISCDDFFSASITDTEWDTYTPEQKCRRCIDWQRLRSELLVPLLAGQAAKYHPYSMDSEDSLASHWIRKSPAKVIILDGIYSGLPELSDIVDLSILVNVRPEVRYERHNLREGSDDAAWHARWDPAEDYYFAMIRPSETFDLVVHT